MVSDATVYHVRLFQSTRPARGATLCRHLSERISRAFQSTRPARGATLACVHAVDLVVHFNPRAPRGARLYCIPV